MRKLLTLDSDPALSNESLKPFRGWVTELESDGRPIKDASKAGHLGLGLRSILARHVLFPWNRMGFSIRFPWNRMGFSIRQQAICRS